MATRFLKLTDLFEFKCKKCGSTDVKVTVDHCEECGGTVNADCNSCGNSYDYYEFKRIEE